MLPNAFQNTRVHVDRPCCYSLHTSVILQVFYLNLFHTTNLDNLEDFE